MRNTLLKISCLTIMESRSVVERKPDCPQGSTMLCFSLALSVFGIFCSELYKQKKSNAPVFPGVEQHPEGERHLIRCLQTTIAGGKTAASFPLLCITTHSRWSSREENRWLQTWQMIPLIPQEPLLWYLCVNVSIHGYKMYMNLLPRLRPGVIG